MRPVPKKTMSPGFKPGRPLSRGGVWSQSWRSMEWYSATWPRLARSSDVSEAIWETRGFLQHCHARGFRRPGH
jgi:hypothetical protein